LAVIQTVIGYVIFLGVVLPGTLCQHLLCFVAFQDFHYLVKVTTGGCPIDPRPVSLIDVILIEAIGAPLRGCSLCASSKQIPSALSGWEDNLRLGR
jgi:hypothetical protein